ncbi:MAG: hypothetical protein U0636_05400 [Phycisphaerales bacterium]
MPGTIFCLMLAAQAGAQMEIRHYDMVYAPTPARIAVSAWQDMLKWYGVEVNPATFDQAMHAYVEAMDAVLTDCMPFAAQLADAGGMNRPFDLTPDELSRLATHQKRMVGVAAAAEDALFTTLDAAPGLTPEARARLAIMRRACAVRRAADAVQVRELLQGNRFTMWPSAGMPDRLVSMNQPLEVRAAFAAALDASAEARIKAWQAVAPAVDAAVAKTLERVAELHIPKPGAMYLEHPLPTRVLVEAWKAEMAALKPALATLPPAEALLVCSRSGVFQWLRTDEDRQLPGLPAGYNRLPSTVDLICSSVLAAQEWPADVRSQIEAICADWMRQDAALQEQEVVQRVERSMAAQAGLVPDGDDVAPVGGKGAGAARAARTALAGRMLQQLSALSQLPWLKTGEAVPRPQVAARPQSDERRQAPFSADKLNRYMVPEAPSKLEQGDLLDRMRLTPEQRAVAELIFADLERDVGARTKEIAQAMKESRERDGANPSDPDPSAVAAGMRVKRHAERRECISAVVQMVAQAFAKLREAIGAKDATGQAWLTLAEAVWVRDLTTTRNPFYTVGFWTNQGPPDPADVAMGIRGAPDERAAVQRAVAAQWGDMREVEQQAIMRSLALQEAMEASMANPEPRDLDDAAREKWYQEFVVRIGAIWAAGQQLVDDLRTNNARVVYGACAALPPALADRLQRAMRLAGHVTLVQADWKRVNEMARLERTSPELVAQAERAMDPELTAWETFACQFLDRMDVVVPATAPPQSDAAKEAIARRAGVVRCLLAPAQADHITLALKLVPGTGVPPFGGAAAQNPGQ